MALSWRSTGAARGSVLRSVTTALNLTPDHRISRRFIVSTPSTANCLVSQVDHLGILADNAEELLALFAETLRLPLMMPITDHGGWASGAVYAGRTGLEVVRAAGRLRRFASPGRAARLWLIVLRTAGDVDASLAELDVRGIPHREEAPGDEYRNVTLTDLSPSQWVFLFHPGPDWDHRYPPTSLPQIDEQGGGLLGLEDVKEIVVGARNFDRAEARWRQVLAPLEPVAPGHWRFDVGPAIRIEPADEDGIPRLVLTVRDLDRATRVLRDEGLLGETSHARVALAPDRVGALRLELVESQRA
jgi:hypothetical protein